MTRFTPGQLPIPMVQAPMAGGTSTPALAAAVSVAGGLGFVAAGYLAPDALHRAIDEVEGRLDGRAYGVNLFAPPGSPAAPQLVEAYAARLRSYAAALGVELGRPRWDDDHYRAKLQLVIERRVPVVSFTFGCPTPSEVERLRSAGSAVWITVTTVAEARAAYAVGADALVVQGVEAGGHRGGFDDARPGDLPLLPLLQLTRDAVGPDLELIATGGLATGAAIAAVLTAGAAAAQLGTAFMLCDEAGTSEAHRERLADPASETVLTRVFTGRTARALTNRFVADHQAAAPSAYPELHHLTAPLRAAARTAGDTETMHLWAGQTHALTRSGAAADIVNGLAADARRAIAETADRLGREPGGFRIRLRGYGPSRPPTRRNPMTSLWLDDAETLETDAWVPEADYDDVIVGAGLTGLVTAVMLVRAGRRVAVLEARHVGAVTTGNTTGKLSLLQGTRLSSILSAHSEKVASAYVDGNRAGMEWILRYCDEHAVPYDRRDAWTYAGTPRGSRTVDREFTAARRAGLPVLRHDETELPFPTYGAIRLPDQAQLYPQLLLAALAREFRAAGGVLVEGCRVEQARAGRDRVQVETSSGVITADQVVLASGIPFLDRGLYFAKLDPQRSHAQAVRVPGPIPSGMYLSADAPTRSLRTAHHGTEELLVVGGNGHEVGRHPHPTTALVADLTRWTEERFPGAVVTHTWSAQDYESPNAVPFAGELPRSHGRIFVATGYAKWGMSNAPMAALMITSRLLGEKRPSWAKTLNTRISKPAAALDVIRLNAEVGVAATVGWAGAELKPLPVEADLGEAEGRVGARGTSPIAVSKVDGRVCRVSAVCSHLGGIVRWNDLERSWDCPLHGSRFAADGSVLEGPATTPLAPTD